MTTTISFVGRIGDLNRPPIQSAPLKADRNAGGDFLLREQIHRYGGAESF